MKTHLSGSLFITAWLCLLGMTSAAALSPERAGLPDFDRRAGKAAVAAADGQQAAVVTLRAEVAGAGIDFNEVAGGPKWIRSRDGYLSGPGGEGKGISAAVAAGFATDDPHRAAKAFVQEHQALFGYGPDVLASARVYRDYVTPHNGMKTTLWQQELDGIEVYEAVFAAHTTKAGELIGIASQFLADPAAAASASRSQPVITGQQAVVNAAGSLEEPVDLAGVKALGSGATGQEQRQQFSAGPFNQAIEVRLVWLPMNPTQMRLCWEVTLTSHARGETFRLLVDAQTGEVQVRRCLTVYLSEASYRVYTSDSPSPFSPGWSTPNSGQPALTSRVLVTWSALDTNASPNGWIDDGVNETRGNNVDAHTDRDANDVPDLPRPQGSPSRVFDFPMDLGQSPTTYTNAAVVQMFYWCNFMHDKLYELGFTEAAGNFQNNNFGRGGLGNDALQADAQDGSGYNNANFTPTPDGTPPRIQMYIFNGPTPNRDGDFDAEVVLHEYTHGLSCRLVGGGVGISALQTEGMGEGWSDFYALALLSEAGDDVNGCYASGGYVTYMLSGMTQNYYFGIRRYPYCTDMTKNPLTFKDIDPAQASSHTGIPRSPIIDNTADEMHNMGEVWCMTLREARANLINKYGWAVGNPLILQLVTDGMKLSPANPNFLQARDAILQADLVDTGGANQYELWAAFAKRGMGHSATSPSSSTTTGLHEAYDIPDALRISPTADFTSSGPVGGPFSPNSITLTLTNAGSSSLSWTLVNTSTWLNVSPASGTLNPGGPAASVTASLTVPASSLPMGVYTSTVWFTNLTSQAVQNRQFTLRVGQPDYYTELFDTTTNDMAFKTFTFTPDGSANFYSVCQQPAAVFPTDPTGGTLLSLTDDSYSSVTLSGGNTVAIYGTRSGVLYVGSNGYLTMNSGDTSYEGSLSAHFSLPRVSALFDDLNPGAGGTISWKQLSDRVAVTYQNVPEYGITETNSFQMELFYDGRIRLTCLQISALDGLAGLSAGTGVPANFQGSDFSAYELCSLLSLQLPASATEGSGVLTNAGIVWIGGILPTNFPVSLTSSVPGRLTVPATTTITAGQLHSPFNLNVVDNSIHDGDQTVTVTASAPGFGNASASMLIIDDDNVPPVITLQPTNQTVVVGGTATFAVTAGGTPPLTYQWRFNGTNVVWGTNTSLTLTNVQLNQAGNYTVLVTNAFGSILSSNAVLAVNLPSLVPVITGFSPISGPAGISVTISGTNFSPVLSNNIVYFGAVRAVVSAASVTNLVVTVPAGATYAPITETVNGLTACANAPFLVTFNGSGVINSSSLTSRVDLASGSGPFAMVIADLDGDGKPDLAANNYSSHTISIYRNISTNGSLTAGSFAPRVDLATGTSSPLVMVAADVDGDGKLDLVLEDYNANKVVVLRNLSTPGILTTNSFGAPVNFPVGTGPDGVAVGDLDGDGKPEIVTANYGGTTVSVLRNIGTMGSLTTNSFAPAVSFTVGPTPVNVMIADVDGDGKADVVTANFGSSSQAMSVLRNLSTLGNIAFATTVNFPGLASSYSLAIGDLDGDGKLDVVIGSQPSGQAVSVFRNTSTPGSITTSSFAAHVDFATGGWANSVAIGDLNGDGKPDVAAVTQGSSHLSLFKNTSTPGSFTTSSFATRVDFASGSNPNGVVIGDLDGDGRPDIVFANQYDSTISIYQNVVPFFALDHFAWNPIPSPRFVNTPFAVTIRAQNPTNGLFTNFTGTAILGTTNGIAVNPPVSGNFVQGVWTGAVVIAQTASNLVLRANDGFGHFGQANPINVISLPRLGMLYSGTIALYMWPVGYSGFVLETSGSLLAPATWVVVPYSPIQIGDQYVLPLDMTGTNGYYRLWFPGP